MRWSGRTNLLGLLFQTGLLLLSTWLCLGHLWSRCHWLGLGDTSSYLPCQGSEGLGWSHFWGLFRLLFVRALLLLLLGLRSLLHLFLLHVLWWELGSCKRCCSCRGWWYRLTLRCRSLRDLILRSCWLIALLVWMILVIIWTCMRVRLHNFAIRCYLMRWINHIFSHLLLWLLILLFLHEQSSAVLRLVGILLVQVSYLLHLSSWCVVNVPISNHLLLLNDWHFLFDSLVHWRLLLHHLVALLHSIPILFWIVLVDVLMEAHLWVLLLLHIDWHLMLGRGYSELTLEHAGLIYVGLTKAFFPCYPLVDGVLAHLIEGTHLLIFHLKLAICVEYLERISWVHISIGYLASELFVLRFQCL